MFPNRVIRVIVHPTDFSESSRPAWEAACALARDYRARLFAVHVEPPGPVFAELGAIPPVPVDRDALERRLSEVCPATKGLNVVHVLVDGEEATEILAFAEKAHADLIVMGTHGRSGFGRLIVGSVAEEVLRRAPCPVMTVRTPVPAVVREPAVAAAHECF